jgi:hypothetical protein
LKLAFEDGLTPREEDPFYQKIRRDTRPSLQSRFKELAREAKEIVPLLIQKR